MKSYRLLLNLIMLFCFVTCFGYYLFFNPFGFTSEFNEYGQYVAVFTVLCCWCLLLLLTLLLRKRPNLWQGLIMLIAILLIGCLAFSSYYSFANEYFTNMTVAVLLLAMLLFADIGVLYVLPIVLVVLFFWQLPISYKQMQLPGFTNQRLNIRGTLQNSGLFSWYIISQLPFVYYLFFDMPALLIREKKLAIPKKVMSVFMGLKVVVFAMVFALVVAIIWQSQSRTAIMALGALLLCFFIIRYGKKAATVVLRLPRVLSCTVVGILIIVLGYMGWYLYNVKKLSAITRVMTLDIAKDHLTDHVWLGAGIGRVSWYYPQWQAQYFATHPQPSNYYFLSADESFYLFNEYIELYYMMGLPGFIAFVFLLIWFFTARSVKHKALLQAAKLAVIAILVCGISAYPFHVPVLMLVLACCFAIAVSVRENKWSLLNVHRIPVQLNNITFRALPFIATILAGVVAYCALGQWQAKKEWNKLHNQLFGSPTEITTAYARLYKTLHYDGKFLTDYGMALAEDSADCKKASLILEEAKRYFISQATIEALAQAYKKQHDHKKAIVNYEWLCHYIPNRFRTKLELLKLYVEAGDTVRAKQTANMILTMPVKLRSHELDRIKEETTAILTQLQ